MSYAESDVMKVCHFFGGGVLTFPNLVLIFLEIIYLINCLRIEESGAKGLFSLYLTILNDINKSLSL